MLKSVFTGLVEEAIDAARAGELLSESLIEKILNHVPPSNEFGGLHAIAKAIRQLDDFCDWGHWPKATKFVDEGIPLDEIHLAMSNWRREFFENGPYRDAVDSLVQKFVEMQESTLKSGRTLRDFETLMGFDQQIIDEAVRKLGGDDFRGMPSCSLKVLPPEMVFPLQRPLAVEPFDYRLHTLVRELVNRLDEPDGTSWAVIENCGHVLAETLYADNKVAAAEVVHSQLTMLADSFVTKHPRDPIGLCWRGYLACLVGDREVAEEFAERVWGAISNASTETISSALFFLDSSGHSDATWAHETWGRLSHDTSHLGEIEGAWIDRRQDLAPAVLRKAFLRGDRSPSLLWNGFNLWTLYPYELVAGDLPLEYWIWMAEHVSQITAGSEYYLQLWGKAYDALSNDTDPRLAHSVVVPVLSGAILAKDADELPPIEAILERLDQIHRDGTHRNMKLAALAVAANIVESKELCHLNEADRLAISSAFEAARRPEVSTELNLDAPKEHSGPKHLDQAEITLKRLAGDKTWSNLAAESKTEFKWSEFYYTIACQFEGDAGNFDAFAAHASHGLLKQIQTSITAPILKDQFLRSEFNKRFTNMHPEFGELEHKLILLSEELATTKLGQFLLNQGVRLNRLKELHGPLRYIKECRDTAAHSSNRIDRERAMELYNRLWGDERLVGKIAECFPTPRKR